jgi:AraC-like DNA-binding protein
MTATPAYRPVRFAAGARLALHRHREAYAALVLEGAYEEFSLDGRYACRTGQAVVHPRFHAHGNAFSAGAAQVVDIPVPETWADRHGFAVMTVTQWPELLRLARDNPVAAGQALTDAGEAAGALEPPGWVSGFARAILAGQTVAAAARTCQVSPEHASRMCRRWFGLSPVALRRERRVREAIDALRQGAAISDAAQLAGFSDQPHLTRILRSLTGLTPGQLRAH